MTETLFPFTAPQAPAHRTFLSDNWALTSIGLSVFHAALSSLNLGNDVRGLT